MREGPIVPVWVGAVLLALAGGGLLALGLLAPYRVASLNQMTPTGSVQQEVTFSRRFTYYESAWTPEGDILYVADASGDLDIFRLGDDLGAPRSLTSNLIDDRHPSVVGDQLAYTTITEDGPALVLRGLEGGSAQPLPDAQTPAWSPDGQWLAYSTTGGILSLIDLDGVDPQPLTEGAWPAWAPDGTRLVYEVAGSLALINADGSGQTRLTDSAGVDRRPAWSPDGQTIVFHSNRAGKADIWAIAPDGSGLRNITQTEHIAETYPTWSPDGFWILHARQETEIRRSAVITGGVALVLAAVVAGIWWYSRP